MSLQRSLMLDIELAPSNYSFDDPRDYCLYWIDFLSRLPIKKTDCTARFFSGIAGLGIIGSCTYWEKELITTIVHLTAEKNDYLCTVLALELIFLGCVLTKLAFKGRIDSPSLHEQVDTETIELINTYAGLHLGETVDTFTKTHELIKKLNNKLATLDNEQDPRLRLSRA